MSHAKNKLKWCITKAKEEEKHRGLLEIKPNIEKARKHIEKAEHYLKATNYLKKDFSDISASTVFYSMYHCLLAIAVKFGYESRNQECTFALMYNLIEEKRIDMDKALLDKISFLDIEKSDKSTSIEIREKYQYGTKLSLETDIYKDLFELAIKIISETKEIIEE